MAAPKEQIVRHLVKINLIYSQGAGEKIATQFLKWLIAYGRYIVIVAEVVVVTTFVTRFKLDDDLSKLKEEIGTQTPYITYLSKDEATIKLTQTRLSTIKTTFSKTPNWTSFLKMISKQTPTGVIFNVVNLEPVTDSTFIQFRITGKATTNNNLATFLSALKKDIGLKEVDLTSITFEQSEISFVITGKTTQ